MIHYITSKTNSRIKEIIKLKDSNSRREQGLFLVEGFHLLEMALAVKSVRLIVTTKPLPLPDSLEQLVVNGEIMRKLSSVISPQGVIGVCQLLTPSNKYGQKIVYLDGVQDPGNVGTILRSALAFGFDEVILSPQCASVYNEKVISASQGAIFGLTTRTATSEVLLELKNNGYQIVVTALKEAQDLREARFANHLVVVLGSEGQGVSVEVLALANLRIKIRIKGIDSLNVAVAGGIIMNAIVNR